jgi:hypothetical protein
VNAPVLTEPNRQVALLLDQAAKALADGDLPAVHSALLQAYRIDPIPTVLYRLATLALVEGRTLAAHDLMRRYAADPTVDVNAQSYQVAQRLLGSPREPCGEVEVRGERGALVRADGQLVGELPLSQPILLSPGKHTVGLDFGEGTAVGTVKVPLGRGVEIRFNRESGAVLVSAPKAVLTLTHFMNVPPEQRARLMLVSERAIRRSGLAVFQKEVALAKAPALADCLDTVLCQDKLATENAIEYVLSSRTTLTKTAQGDEWAIQLELLDAATGQPASRLTKTCPGCAIDPVESALAQGIQGLIEEGSARPRGTLVLTSEPPGADVSIAGNAVGVTPYRRAMWLGDHTVTLSQAEYTSQTRSFHIAANQETRVEVKLAAVPKPVALLRTELRWEQQPRPRWRVITGAVGAAVGLTLLGFGTSALVVDQRCIDEPVPPASYCRTHYDTKAPGAALITIGATFAIGGASLLILPGPRRQVALTASLRPRDGSSYGAVGD